MLAVLTPAAVGVVNTCRAKNLTQGTAADTRLQRVIKAAKAGDTISVRYVCVGNFRIAKDLALVGKATPTVSRPVLNGNGTGQVLRVNGAKVRLANLKISGGVLTIEGCSSGPDPTGCGGGIAVNLGGTLTLRDSVVRGNTARLGGGIYIDGQSSSVILNGASSVTGNSTEWDGPEGDGLGGGILSHGTLILNGSSSVSGNRGGGGGGIMTTGTLTLNDSSSVSGNTVIGPGGGIWLDSGTVTLNDTSSVTGNTADSDDFGGGAGGGIDVVWGCASNLIGAIEGGNVNDNYSGTASPVEDNIFVEHPCP
jgi:hypothetical protein